MRLIGLCWFFLMAGWVQADDLLGEVTPEIIVLQPGFTLPEGEQPAISDEWRDSLQGLELVVLFGTWCHDSVREVPRLMALVQALGLKATYFAVSRDKEEPMVVVERYHLRHTPTVVVLRNGEEIGRIVERPHTNWLEDLQALAVI